MSRLVAVLTAEDTNTRNLSLDELCRGKSLSGLLEECEALEVFRRRGDNIYQSVRALFFLYAIHRFHIPARNGLLKHSCIPFEANKNYLDRRFEEAIQILRGQQSLEGPSDAISSGLAAAYRGAAFQILAEQVHRSVRSFQGNQWMFRNGQMGDYPLRIRPELNRCHSSGSFPVLHEATPVRVDLTHSAWSDIFFLGMDFPEGARVLNISLDLSAVEGKAPQPPVEAYVRVINRPVLRLVSVDLKSSAEIKEVSEVFDFGRDYLGLLKAAVIAAGIVPPSLEGATKQIGDVLTVLTGSAHRGLEVVSRVKDIPRGSRLAVSTNLLACLISAMMRASGQVRNLSGLLDEKERRLIAARAILGEWLGGSGGGWQDSAGLWPGVKLIEGVQASSGDVEYGLSRGTLLPNYQVLGHTIVSPEVLEKLKGSLVLVHGGMAQDVGPILQMVTEKYLLRGSVEWRARLEAIELLEKIVKLFKNGQIRDMAYLTQRNFDGPLQDIIPWAGNAYTESLIHRVRSEFKDDFWGFWMLGGMSGGGMGFFFNPTCKAMAESRLRPIMIDAKKEFEAGMPFAIEPIVYSFEINEKGTCADFRGGEGALLPSEYYNLKRPSLAKKNSRKLPKTNRIDLQSADAEANRFPAKNFSIRSLTKHLLPKPRGRDLEQAESLKMLLAEYGFDGEEHERIRGDLRCGNVGLARNRLEASTTVENARADDVFNTVNLNLRDYEKLGKEALARGEVAVVTLAGGIGSRWNKGAGVVKALNPFCQMDERYRNFIEIHMAKTNQHNQLYSEPVPHIFTTSYLTHRPIANWLAKHQNNGCNESYLSSGKSVGLRFVPMVRDLRFAWEEMQQQSLDEQEEKVRGSVRDALISWAQQIGEGSDYTDNLPLQCMHPTGHWYEIPNMLRNGLLLELLRERPTLSQLMVHNIDTLGANVDPTLLGCHLSSGADMTTELISRRLEDSGGGLARVNGQLRLIEGTALPREELEFSLTYYNTNTFWVDIDRLLACFNLDRGDLSDQPRVDVEVRRLAKRLPTYITLKEAKKRWGKGQEDVFPVAQFEKLWVDMTSIPELRCHYVGVSRMRGQQLKEPSQLDGWLRDGSAAYVESICDFPSEKF